MMSNFFEPVAVNISSQRTSQSFDQDRFHEIATYLRQVRLTQGWSITDMAQRSSLAPFLIQIIERGDFQDLPETLPSGVCIQRYADALGLKGSEVASGLSRRASAR
ncbi:MAG: helix-turn-helix domain-containing protein [Spirulina sp.]